MYDKIAHIMISFRNNAAKSTFRHETNNIQTLWQTKATYLPKNI